MFVVCWCKLPLSRSTDFRLPLQSSKGYPELLALLSPQLLRAMGEAFTDPRRRMLAAEEEGSKTMRAPKKYGSWAVNC